jgi:hypothetical protein
MESRALLAGTAASRKEATEQTSESRILIDQNGRNINTTTTTPRPPLAPWGHRADRPSGPVVTDADCGAETNRASAHTACAKDRVVRVI